MQPNTPTNRARYALERFFPYAQKGKVYMEINFDSGEISEKSLNKIYANK